MYEVLKFKKKLIEEYLLLQEKYAKIYMKNGTENDPLLEP